MEVIVAVLVVLALAGLALGFLASLRRRKELAAWARSKGLRFDPGKDRTLPRRFGGFKCLSRGHSRYAYNVMQGDWSGSPLLAFDYHYTTGSGKNRQDHSFSAVIVGSATSLKPLVIRAEGFFDRVGEFFGFDDIDFESAEFSRRFYVSSPDRRWAYDVIHQGMMEYLLGAPQFSVQFGFKNVMAWRSSKFSTKEFEKAIELIQGMLSRLPDYVVREQAGRD